MRNPQGRRCPAHVGVLQLLDQVVELFGLVKRAVGGAAGSFHGLFQQWRGRDVLVYVSGPPTHLLLPEILFVRRVDVVEADLVNLRPQRRCKRFLGNRWNIREVQGILAQCIRLQDLPRWKNRRGANVGQDFAIRSKQFLV